MNVGTLARSRFFSPLSLARMPPPRTYVARSSRSLARSLSIFPLSAGAKYGSQEYFERSSCRRRRRPSLGRIRHVECMEETNGLPPFVAYVRTYGVRCGAVRCGSKQRRERKKRDLSRGVSWCTTRTQSDREKAREREKERGPATTTPEPKRIFLLSRPPVLPPSVLQSWLGC